MVNDMDWIIAIVFFTAVFLAVMFLASALLLAVFHVARGVGDWCARYRGH